MSERKWIQRGKWSEESVPHAGWECIGVEDLGDDEGNWNTCEMCESQSIRYVHSMVHPDYWDTLDCGCVCAGHMEGSVDVAKARERRYKQAEARKAKRLQRWLDMGTWRVSDKGNYWRREAGSVITIFRQGGRWKTLISNESTGLKRYSSYSYSLIINAVIAVCREYSTR
jgi:hypothetical protein